MNFSTENLEPIVNRSFQVIQEYECASKREQYHSSSKATFFLRQNKPYFLMNEKRVTDNLDAVPVTIMDVNCSLKDAVKMIKDMPAALIRKGESYVGYITQEKLMEQLLIQNEQMDAYLKAILNTIEGSCTVINEEAKVVCWSKGAEKLFSIKQKDIIGKPITDHFITENLEILNTLKYGNSVYQHQHHARNDLVVLINSSPIVYQDRNIGAVVSETDITHLLRLNNELYKTSEKLFNLEEKIRKSSHPKNPFSYIKGSSNLLQDTIKLAKRAASTDAPVLIYGASGVGKELFAKAVHSIREKETAPFIAINCGAISESLFESEIFGYESGAFSGADQKGKKGKAALASGGTLFLDEVGEMPLDMQVKFLRLLQEKRFYPLGGTKEIEADFRVIAATNRNLKELVEKGEFREDLYYRLNVVHFTVPALKDRPQDIIELTHYFLYELSIKYNRPIYGISQEVMQSLLNYTWPGNIRELRNVIERMIVFSENNEIKQADLPVEIEGTASHSTHSALQQNKESNTVLADKLEGVEKDIILHELSKANGNKVQCAESLGITRATLYNRMKKLKIDY